MKTLACESEILNINASYMNATSYRPQVYKRTRKTPSSPQTVSLPSFSLASSLPHVSLYSRYLLLASIITRCSRFRTRDLAPLHSSVSRHPSGFHWGLLCNRQSICKTRPSSLAFRTFRNSCNPLGKSLCWNFHCSACRVGRLTFPLVSRSGL